MVFDLMIKKFIKDSENIKSEKVRNAYGFFGGIVGIIINLILFAIKLTVGLLVSSIAITADAFNNFSDAGSSFVTILGFKLASKPADKEHPFGHGRMEYLSALIVAFMVMLVGVQFVKTSFNKILNPEAVTFELIPFILLIISILFKLWLSRFNKYVGEKINSSALKASAMDALGDVFTTCCVAVSFLAAKFTTFPIDGYIGLAVALFIVYSGFTLVKDTIDPLLGSAPDPELVNAIIHKVLSYDNILGIHDLVIHNYGPGKCMASIHAEIPSDIDVVTIHEIIDKAERDISKELKIYLVIHIDPICHLDGEVKEAYDEIIEIIDNYPYVNSVHDFRVIGEGDIKNLVFDVILNMDEKRLPSHEQIAAFISDKVKINHPQYNCVITIDNDYI